MKRAKALLWINVVMLVISLVLWVAAVPTGWIDSVTFVSHVSMAALVFAAISGIAGAFAAVEVERG